ncbi:MAG: hypothetical protein KF884_04825 [Fimbriimonadaceae bacterium]|nr:hypothetical protein [Fimbriimonadaceae bacterium]QYK59412.1 MAG: hypothetical protein KF884_04825 [Fimbriimonadaceae bacterium]
MRTRNCSMAAFLAGLFALAAPTWASGEGQSAQLDAWSASRVPFQENKGQWNQSALFLSQTGGLDYWVTRDGMIVDFHRIELRDGQVQRVGNVVRVTLQGADGRAAGYGFGQHSNKTDYLVGAPSSHARGVRSYSEVSVPSITAGSTLRHYHDRGQLRHDVILKPGVDPKTVVWRFEGVSQVKLDSPTRASLGTSLGHIRFSDLRVYQPDGTTNREVSAKFVLLPGNRLSIEVGSYDPRLPVVVDPLVFGSYVGSTGQSDEEVLGVDATEKGDIYITGKTTSVTFPINAGPYNKFNVDDQDAFFVKMDGDAYSVTYAALLGGSGVDWGMSVGFAKDPGLVWLMGTTTSNNFAGAANAKSAGKRLWVARFTDINDVMTPVNVLYLNDPGQAGNEKLRDFGAISASGFEFQVVYWKKNYDMAVSPDGKAFIGGQATVANLTGGGFTNYLANAVAGTAAFVAALNPDGTFLYKRMVGSRTNSLFGGLAVNANGEVVVTGTVVYDGVQDTETAPDPEFVTTAGVFPAVPGVFLGGRWLQNDSVFAVRFNANGDARWACLLGGSGYDFGIAAAFDAASNVHLTGISGSFNFQRTPGAYDQNMLGKVYVTKLSEAADSVIFSTGMNTSGNVLPTCLSVDSRGFTYIGGVLSFTNRSLFVCSPNTQYFTSIPGSIPRSADAWNESAYQGGNSAVNVANGGQDFPSTRDGFILVLNAAGAGLVYGDNIGRLADEVVNDIVTDPSGAVFIGGTTQNVINRDGAPHPTVDTGIAPYISANAFKNFGPAAAGTLPQQDLCDMMNQIYVLPVYAFSNGYVLKLRVALPIVQSLTLTPNVVAAGNGSTSTATVTLRQAAPAGGVTVTLSLSNQSKTSFAPQPGQTTAVLNIPGGATSASLPIYTFTVSAADFSDVKVTLGSDFITTRLSLQPWLQSFSVAPNVVVGGAGVTASVTLAAPAPVGGLAVDLSVDKPSLVDLPTPSRVVVPEGANFANIVVPTKGVDADEIVTFFATYQGTTISSAVTLQPARMVSLTFDPPRLNGGESGTGSIRLNGQTGTARNVTISLVTGQAGVKVNGQDLPTIVQIPALTDSVTFNVTAPFVTVNTQSVIRAQDTINNVQQTLFIDALDIAAINVSPGTDVLGGAVLDCQVRLSRPAGPNGFVVALSNSNNNAATLSVQTIRVAAGQVVSPTFQLRTKTVATDATTILTASRTGYTSRSVTVTVRAISATLTLNPQAVKGGIQNSTGTITLSRPAPPTGLVFEVTSSDTSAATVPVSVSFTSGQTSRAFTVTTRKVPTTKQVLISISAGGGAVTANRSLTVNPPALTSLTFNPTLVTMGRPTAGNLTFESTVAAGTVVTLTASPANLVTLPASVTVPAGRSSFPFTVTTKTVTRDTVVTVTARYGSSVVTGTFTIVVPGVQSLTFSPVRVRGGNQATGTISLQTPAPPGGLRVTLASSNPAVADIIGAKVVTVPEGLRTATFKVQTQRVSRSLAVTFTASFGSNGVTTGVLYVDP